MKGFAQWRRFETEAKRNSEMAYWISWQGFDCIAMQYGKPIPAMTRDFSFKNFRVRTENESIYILSNILS